MFESELCFGLLIGALLAGIFGRILQRIRLLRRKAAQAAKREITVVTKQSPTEIHRASAAARREMWLLIFLLIGLVIGLFYVWIRFGQV